eukprot:gene14161-biopygen17084
MHIPAPRPAGPCACAVISFRDGCHTRRGMHIRTLWGVRVSPRTGLGGTAVGSRPDAFPGRWSPGLRNLP